MEQTQLFHPQVPQLKQAHPVLHTEDTCFAEVLLLDHGKKMGSQTFTYAITENVTEHIQTGVLVEVPFGAMPRARGLVLNCHARKPEGFKVKAIVAVMDPVPLFSPSYLLALQWLADYDCCPLASVIDAALPSVLMQKAHRYVVPEVDSLPSGLSAEATNVLQSLLAKHAEANKGITLTAFARHLQTPLKVLLPLLRQIERQGYLSINTEFQKLRKAKEIRCITALSHSGDNNEADILSKYERILSPLKEQPLPLSLKDAVKILKTTVKTLEKLAELNILTIKAVEIPRDPLSYFHAIGQQTDPLVLSSKQEVAVQQIIHSPPLSHENPNPHLLFGITGSGKTEVYLSLTEKTLAAGKNVMILVPEIALTSQIAARFIARFGRENIALWHSHISDGEKRDTWHRLSAGDLRIVIGARSAVFAPIQQLGLVVIDEEHDQSYKQDSPAPRYNAKTVARFLAVQANAAMVMGSATPDISTYAEARDADRILSLPARYGGRTLPEVSLIDMKQEHRRGRKQIISEALAMALQDNHQNQEQSIVLINRRGYFTLIECVQCQYVFQCPHCAVGLIYHRQKNEIQCHYCGYHAPMPQFCTQCASMELVSGGTGSQRIEEEIKKLLPEARVMRIDSDITHKKHAFAELIQSFRDQAADILVGTQMIAKGLDIANVTLVGVIQADSTLALPDYKASERGFQLLTQVAGRAGRGEKPGKVLLQTYDPSHPIIQYAARQDYLAFYDFERAIRREFDFPPDCQLFRVIITSPQEAQAQQWAEAAVQHWRQSIEVNKLQHQVSILGPAPCPIARIQGRYRMHFLIKNKAHQPGHQLIKTLFTQAKPFPEMHVLLDTDTLSLL
ncbi:MAG: primosomal protein N' [Cyanobacteria bacterium]|nr:primosomal protein N' [Cyanobacteriota bacterium]